MMQAWMPITTLLDQAIDHLPPQQQKVYCLSRHNRLKYDEIASQMGLSRETVKKYIQACYPFYHQFCAGEYGYVCRNSHRCNYFQKKLISSISELAVLSLLCSRCTAAFQPGYLLSHVV
jgi:hypothetical protein